MQTDDFVFFIIELLSQNPPRFSGWQFNDIYSSYLAIDHEVRASIENPQYDNERHKSELISNIRDVIGRLSNKYVYVSRSEIFLKDTDTGLSKTVIQETYSLTKEGLAYLKFAQLFGRVRHVDMEALHYALPYMKSYGEIDFSNIKSVLESLSIKLNVPVIQRFLLDEGFCEVKKAQTLNTYIELTDEGRELKKCGSYHEYLSKIEKIRQKEEETQQLNILLLRQQSELNPLMIEANKSIKITNDNIIATNKTSRKILWITATLTFIIALGTIAPFVRDIYKDMHSVKEQNRIDPIEQIPETNSSKKKIKQQYSAQYTSDTAHAHTNLLR